MNHHSQPWLSLILVLFSASSLAGAKTINVPGDFLSIRLAVDAARDGDVIEVDDGCYFEKNVILSKAVVVRAKNLFGAVIYGSTEPDASIFVVRAAAVIEGFVLKNSYYGILQRDSPDTAWQGRDLALVNLSSGVSINDREANIGQAFLSNIIAEHCQKTFTTNDARGLEVKNSLIAGSSIASPGSITWIFVPTISWLSIADLWSANQASPCLPRRPVRSASARTSSILTGPDGPRISGISSGT